MRATEFITERNNGTRWTGDEIYRQIGDEGQSITELFEPGKPYEWDFRGSEEAHASFMVGNVPYKFIAHTTGGSQWEIEFKIDKDTEDKKAKYGVTGSGKSAEVMSTVTDIMRDFLSMYKDKIKYLTFTAEEESRKSLYMKMAKRLLPTWHLDGNDKTYWLSNPDYINEGIADWAKKGAAAGAIALGALGAGGADAKPIKPVQKPAIVQPAKQQVKQPTQQVVPSAQVKNQAPEEYNVLSNNTNNEVTLQKAAKKAGMKGTELAQFLAQMKHESWDFERMKEKPQPGVKDYYAKRYDMKYSPKTAKILGNKHAGDGAKYHGRGFVQLTGRDNYRMASDALGIDLLNHPELASKPDVAAKIAVWYWQTRVKPGIQNFADTQAVTQKINPALRGVDSRHANFKDYMKII